MEDVIQQVEVEIEEQEQPEVVQENVQDQDDDEGDLVVTFGDEEQPKEEEQESAPDWVRELRKNHKELQRKNRELESKLKEVTAPPKPAAVEVGKKPTLEDSDYDTEKYESELTSWYDRKREADKRSKEAEEAEENQRKEWQSKVDSYEAAKASLKVQDYAESESNVRDNMSSTQQGIILQGTKNPALVVFALGKNEAKLKEISAIKDPILFAFAVARLENEMKVTNRKAIPPPEKVVTGSGRAALGSDAKLEALKEAASKSGDYSKVLEYKRSKK